MRVPSATRGRPIKYPRQEEEQGGGERVGRRHGNRGGRTLGEGSSARGREGSSGRGGRGVFWVIS